MGATPEPSPGQPWLRRAAHLGAVALAAAFALWSLGHFWSQIAPIYRTTAPSSRLDFNWYDYAFQTVWRHLDPARHLYDVARQDRWMVAHHLPYDHTDLYSYPPQFALFWSPLAALPLAAARTLWTQINLGAFFVAVGATAAYARPRLEPIGWLLLSGLGLLAHPVRGNFFWGQSDALTLLLVTVGLATSLRPNPGRAAALVGGACLGLAAVFKVTPAILLVYLPCRWALGRGTPRGRAAGRAAAAGWIVVAASSLVVGWTMGWSILTTYVRRTLPAVERSAWLHGPAPWNQSFRGILMVWGPNRPGLTPAADAFAAAVLAVLLVVVALRPQLDVRLEAAGAALLVLLCAPSLEGHHFTVAVLPWLLLAGYLLDTLPRSAWAWPAAAVFAFGSAAFIQPAVVHWPPAWWAAGGRRLAVPPGHYRRLYLLGASSYGPVHFTLHLRYRGGADGSLPAVWPDWWSPGRPLAPAIPGLAVGHAPHGQRVGLYAFRYPVDPSRTLDALVLPTRLPRQHGGASALHLVAASLRGTDGRIHTVALGGTANADGIVPGPGAGGLNHTSFDGVGNDFWSAHWPTARRWRTRVDGHSTAFRLPQPGRRTFNVVSTPAAAAATAARWPSVLLNRAPHFVSIAAFFLSAVALAAAEPRSARPRAARPGSPSGQGRG